MNRSFGGVAGFVVGNSIISDIKVVKTVISVANTSTVDNRQRPRIGVVIGHLRASSLQRFGICGSSTIVLGSGNGMSGDRLRYVGRGNAPSRSNTYPVGRTENNGWYDHFWETL